MSRGVSEPPSPPTEGVFRRFLRRAPRQSRSLSLVNAVVQALDEVVTQSGDIDDVTIETVSHRAGVGSGSLYEYFTGKDSVLGLLIGRVTEANFERLASQLGSHAAPTLDQLIRLVAKDVVDTYMTHPGRTRVLMDGVGRLRLWGIVTRERDRFAELLTARAQQFVPHAGVSELHATMRLITDATFGVLSAATARAETPDPERLCEELSELALALIQHRHGNRPSSE